MPLFRSIRARLTAWYSLSFGVLLLVFSAFLYLSLARNLNNRLDSALLDNAREAASLFANETAENKGDLTAGARETLDEYRVPNIYISILSGNQLLASSLDEAGMSIEGDWTAFIPERSPVTAVTASKRKLRLASFSSDINGHTCLVVAASPLDDLARQLGSIRAMFYLGVPAALLISGFGGWLLARKSLAPVVEMSNQAELITAKSLDKRLAVSNRDDELGRLAGAFNELLSRLHRSFESMREFMADASHELRTPLSIIRGEADVALSQERSSAEYCEALGIIQDESRRLSRIVDDLLELARADAGQRPPHIEEFYLNDLVEDCCRAAQVLAKNNAVFLNSQHAPDIPFRGDKDLAARMVLNLIDNAIKFTHPGGSISVLMRVNADNVEIEVADTGIGIEPDLASRVFNRFYKDGSPRRHAGSGSGLGLSIAKWVAEVHGGSIGLKSSPGAGSTFTISLPYSRQS